jgi:hypothetical protein
MEQNPRELINDIHERIADDNRDHKILSGYTEDPTVWGIDKKWLLVLLLPALVMFRVSASYLNGRTQLYGLGAAAVLALLGIIAAVATPENVDIQEYIGAIVSKHAHQQEMLHDSDPDESRLEQPKNDSLLGRFTRLPLVKDWPVIGAGDYEPTQTLIPHKKPFRGEYAIELDDGSFIAGIEIEAVPLRLASKDAREQVERAVANALEGTVDYHAQWISPTRVADFEARRSDWKERAHAYQSEADRLMSAGGEQATIDAIRKQILADIADERAAGINLREDVKRVQDHYMLVSVEPGEAVVDHSAEAGGLASVPGLGWLIEKYRVRKQAGSDEHVSALVRKLERRADDIERELSHIDGLTPQTLSSGVFSEVIADYYRGVNVRAHDEFTDAIRGSPVPDGEAAGDPEHETSYSHITNRDRAGSPPSPTPSPSGPTIHAAADGGAVRADGTDEADEADEPDASTSDQQTESETQ